MGRVTRSATLPKRHLVWAIVRILLLVYVGLGLTLTVAQRWLIYLPQRELGTDPGARGWTFEDLELRTGDGETLHAWWIPCRDDGTQADAPVVLLLHGNAGNISHRLGLVARYRAAGCHCLLLEWRGYGRSSGSPSEQGLYADADAAWCHLHEERGIATSRIVVHGRSLGGGPASWLATTRPVAGLILDSTFSSLAQLAGEQYPVYPVGLMLRDRYPSVDHLSRLTCPLLVLHSADDRQIPIHHGEALLAAAPGPQRLIRLRGGHNDVLHHNGARYTDALRTFIHSLGGAAAP